MIQVKGWAVWLAAGVLLAADAATSLPPGDAVKPVEVVRTGDYSEGIVFDRAGNGYFSHDKVITKVTPDGKDSVWSEPGQPNGHKILADGTHLVCDASHHAV